MNDHNSPMFCYTHIIVISAGGSALTPPIGQLYLTYGVSLTSHLKLSMSEFGGEDSGRYESYYTYD